MPFFVVVFCPNVTVYLFEVPKPSDLLFLTNTLSDHYTARYSLSENDMEYYRNRCSILERENTALCKRLEKLEQENHQLGEENRHLREEIAAIRDTVSALIARNINAKPDKRHSNTIRKDSQSNHSRKSRNKPTRVDSTITVDQKTCSRCGTHLSEPTDTYERIVEDIVPARIIVTKYVITRRYCRNCKRQVSGATYNALPNERFGLRLMVLTVSLKLLGLSYQKISCLLKMLFGLHITESTINHAVKKISQAFGKRYEQMILELKTERNIHGDETSWRINGKNHWLWAFVGKQTVLYEIDKSRGRTAPMRILKGYDGNITSDSWPAWNHVGTTHQRCQWHYLNDLEDTTHYKNPSNEFVLFAKRLQKILYYSQDCSALNKDGRIKAKKNLERRISGIISKKYADKNCIRFVKRLRRERKMLFTFLQTGTDYHNNTAERAIRPNVVIRKITNGHRSESGAHSHKVLMSVKETCRCRGLNFYDYSMEYLSNVASKS